MTLSTEKQSWIPPLLRLSLNPLTLSGLFLVNATVVSWLSVLPVATREGSEHPYLSLFFLGALPTVFLGGLALSPLGIWLRYRRQMRTGVEARQYAPIGWASRDVRVMVGFLGAVTGFNVLAGGHLSQATVHYMDSPGFCGTVCHSMVPEYTAYRDSPHVNIACVQCHIGEGGSAYFRAKLNGMRQVALTALHRYPTPIPTPLKHLRPARDICESCHWPEKFGGVRMRVLEHFAPDSANTHTYTVLAILVGGGFSTGGIHGFHTAPGVAVEYAADSSRQQIDWVSYTSADGTVTEYASSAWRTGRADAPVRRTMDCLDCHTRPSHRFQMPERALDEAMAADRIDPALPWIKLEGLTLLEAEYENLDRAADEMPQALTHRYRTAHPDVFASFRESIRQAGEQLVATYARNVFPEMGVRWGTYPNHSGHTDFPGCFRCHGAGLVSETGDSVSSDCEACHRILALAEKNPHVVEELGLDLVRVNGVR